MVTNVKRERMVERNVLCKGQVIKGISGERVWPPPKPEDPHNNGYRQQRYQNAVLAP